MKLNLPNFLLAALFWLAASFSLSAQVSIPTDSTRQYTVETTDGNIFIGRIVGQTPETLVLKTDNLGEINIPKRNLRSIRAVRPDQIVAGEYWPDNPHGTRYLFGPNGYGLRKGEGYYSNIWIFYNQFSYGFTNNFTLGVGIVPLFFFGGTASPAWITPKFSIPIQRNKVNLGVGGLFATVLGGGEDFRGSFGVAYGQLTIGSRDRNFNVGAGYGYAGDDWANTPTITFGGIYRTGRKFALMTENYLFDTGDDNYVLLSFAGRFIGRSVAIDAGLIIPTATDGVVVAIPILGVNVPLGRPAGN